MTAALPQSKIVTRRDLRQAAALMAVQAMTYAMPLVLIPFLGRTLGPDSFGRLAIGQSLGAYITIVVQYGFNYSGTRAIAQALDDSEALAARVRDILGAKLLLLAGCLLAGLGMLAAHLDFALGSRLFWSAFAWGAANGLTLLWYFQGSHRLDVCAYIDCAGRLGALGLILALVRTPGDAYLVLLLQGAGSALAIAVELRLLYAKVPVRMPAWRPALGTLAEGFHVFASRCVESVYLTGTTLILGMTRPPAEVGYFAGPEKIVRAAAYGLFPFYQVAYPRLVSELRTDRAHALRYARITIMAVTGAALAAAAVLYFGAETIVRMLLGPQFAASAGVLKTLAPAMVLMVAVGGAGSNLMLALGRDKWLTGILAAGGLFCAAATFPLSAALGAYGACISLLATYALILGLIWRHFRKWGAQRGSYPEPLSVHRAATVRERSTSGLERSDN